MIFGFGLLCIYLMRGLTYADPSTGIAPLVKVFILMLIRYGLDPTALKHQIENLPQLDHFFFH